MTNLNSGNPIKGIAFNTADEGVDYPQQAINAVKRAYWEYFESVSGIYVDAYVVSFTYVLGKWKALVSTPLADGRYYEVTFNGKEAFVDCYVKTHQKTIEAEDLL